MRTVFGWAFLMLSLITLFAGFISFGKMPLLFSACLEVGGFGLGLIGGHLMPVVPGKRNFFTAWF